MGQEWKTLLFALNSEETGTLVLLGQVALAQGDFANAEQRFAHAGQANPRAVSVWFLRSYIAWKQRELGNASVMPGGAGMTELTALARWEIELRRTMNVAGKNRTKPLITPLPQAER